MSIRDRLTIAAAPTATSPMTAGTATTFATTAESSSPARPQLPSRGSPVRRRPSYNPWQLGARPTRASPGRLFRQLLPQRLDHEVHQRCVGANAVELQLPVQALRNPRRELDPRLFTTIRHFRLPLSKACT